MSLSSYILNALSLRQKIVIILLFSSVMLGIVSVCIMRSEWIFSLLCGSLSYILLMIVTFQSIRTKITQKIQEADTEEKLLKYTSKYDDDTQDITQKVISQDSKHNLKTTESMQTQNEAMQHNENSQSCHIERSEISNMKNIESKLSKNSIDTNSSLSPNIQNNTNSPKTTENTESNPNTKQSKKEKSKERLKLLDLSKASLGFELSFSLPKNLCIHRHDCELCCASVV